MDDLQALPINRRPQMMNRVLPKLGTDPLPGVSLVVFVLVFASIRCSAVELCSDFKRMLNGDPPVSYFKVGFSNIFQANKRPIQGWVYYEGAIQNDTFWVRNSTNSPAQPAIIMPGWLVGMSHSNYWCYSNEKLTISPRESSMPSPVDERAQNVMSMAKQALGIGSPILPGSVRVHPDNSFEAKVTRGTNLINIAGHFDVAPDGRPLRCEYKATQMWLDSKVVVVYEYAEINRSACLPTAFKIETFKLLKSVDRAEYQILACEFGDVSLPASGYVIDLLTNLGGINLKYRDFVGTVVFRDGAIYNMDKKGQLKLIGKNSSHGPANVNNRTFVRWCLLLVTTIPLIWIIARTIGAFLEKRATTK